MSETIYIMHHTNEPQYGLRTEIDVYNYLYYGLMSSKERRYRNRNPGSPECTKIIFSWGDRINVNIYGELHVERKLQRNEFIDDDDSYNSVYLISKVVVYTPKITQSKASEIIQKKWYQLPVQISDEQYSKLTQNVQISNYEKVFEDLISNKPILSDSTETEIIAKSRLGQSKLRNILIEHYKKCVVCDIDIPELLIASHIKPWSVCSNEERLDPANVLQLCPLHDKLFEKGYFTINSDYKLIISSSIPDNIIEKLGLKNPKTSFNFMKNTKNYLEYHMSNKLKK